MRLQSALVAVALGAVSGGCGTFWTDTVRNITEAPVRGADDCRTIFRNRHLADEAWRQVEQANPGLKISPDHADGFKTGFAEYLYAGGNGQPPAVPPFPYTLARYQTAQGHVAIVEWYDGYREGAEAARASGLRELMVIPLSAPPINAIPDRVTGPTRQPELPHAEPPPEPDPELLPPPRVLPPPD